jgi:hypothetical protein
MSRLRFSPALAIATIALFFAVGGSAFAIGQKTAPQARCGQGTVRGLAEVTGLVDHGAANIPDHYAADSTPYLGRHFSCGGGAIQVKRTDRGTFYVKFSGNAASTAVASAWGSDPAGAAVNHQPDGSFQVIVGSHSAPEDESFTIVVF